MMLTVVLDLLLAWSIAGVLVCFFVARMIGGTNDSEDD
jgi:hypothetical protein